MKRRFLITAKSKMRYLIGRYHEVALKGGNRWRFVDQIKNNLRKIFGDYDLGRAHSLGSRLMIELPDSIADEVVRERAALIFGLQNFSISYPAPLEIEGITREAIARARGIEAKTFRVSTSRDNKRFPLNSMEIDREVGGAVADEFGFKVDLENPELTISIEILPDGAFVSAGKLPGAGGLPVGITGRGLTLLSGGIDSPVAAHRMMKRGLHADFVHFHGHPLVTTASRDKALELGDSSDALRGACDADAGAVRNFAARDRGEESASTPRRDVSALHDAHRGRAGGQGWCYRAGQR